MQHAENSPQVAVGRDTCEKSGQSGISGKFVILKKQKNKLYRHECHVRSVEGAHPPEVGGDVWRKNIVDGHGERVFNIKENDGEPGEDGHHRKEYRPVDDGHKILHPEDMADCRNDAEPGGGDDEKDVGRDEDAPGYFPGDIVGMMVADAHCIEPAYGRGDNCQKRKYEEDIK